MYRGQARAKQAMAGDLLAQRRGSGDPHAPDQQVIDGDTRAKANADASEIAARQS
jgi:hypothetical protein